MNKTSFCSLGFKYVEVRSAITKSRTSVTLRHSQLHFALGQRLSDFRVKEKTANQVGYLVHASTQVRVAHSQLDLVLGCVQILR